MASLCRLLVPVVEVWMSSKDLMHRSDCWVNRHRVTWKMNGSAVFLLVLLNRQTSLWLQLLRHSPNFEGRTYSWVLGYQWLVSYSCCHQWDAPSIVYTTSNCKYYIWDIGYGLAYRGWDNRGTVHFLPMKCLYLGSSGLTATAVSPSIVSGLVVATGKWSALPAIGYLKVNSLPDSSVYSTFIVKQPSWCLHWPIFKRI